MATYAFTVIVDGLDLDDVAALDALYTDDFEILPGEIDTLTTLDFVIEAASGEEALSLALGHLNGFPNLTPLRVDEDLVNVPEIADRLDVSREAVRLWASGARSDGFPVHRTVIGSQKIWAWADVYAWAFSLGKITTEVLDAPLDAPCVTWANGQLVVNRQKKTPGTGWQTFDSLPDGSGAHAGDWAAFKLSVHRMPYASRSGLDWHWLEKAAS